MSESFLSPDDIKTPLLVVVEWPDKEDKVVWLKGFKKPLEWSFPKFPPVGEVMTLVVWQGMLVPMDENERKH